MTPSSDHKTTRLSVVIPCFNESATLKACVEQVLCIADETLSLEIIIVDDHSTDDSPAIGHDLETCNKAVRVLRHHKNQGKGAALRTGFAHATGDFIAIHDADLEYDPNDLKRLLGPLIADKADVVIGSRFLSPGAHRVLYFWHSVANKILTLLSNMLTDLNLTDMECCHKIFRSDVIKSIDLKENRFGFEPEIVAKVAQKRLRIYEMGVSYEGRTYAEGKKIGWKDAFRAIYCILHYNLPYNPPYIQFFFYLFVGGAAALVNMIVFLFMFSADIPVEISAPFAFFVAALVNYLLSIAFVFRHKTKWRPMSELVVFFVVVVCVAALDLWVTKMLLALGYSPGISKGTATAVALLLNYTGRRYIVFPSSGRRRWSNRIRRK
jgi:glycosyltransferase involved in cell wall biosynthesis